MPSQYPARYLTFNDQNVKQLNVAVEIEGVSDILSLNNLYTRIRYGDPNLNYGDPGIVYGGLRGVTNSRAILSLDSNLVIGQKVEPEQGRGSVSTMTLNLVDVDGYATNLVTPGKVVDEILGNKLVKVRVGYLNTSYPDDYYTCFRGYVANIKGQPTRIILQLSDANQKRRQQVFFSAKTKLTSSIAASDVTIPVIKTEGFYDQILGPDGNYDSSVNTYIAIDDEVMEYGPGDVGATSFTVTRGARFTTPAAHSINAEVKNTLQLEGNSIDLMLKVMLSGFNGPFIEDQDVLSIRNTLSIEGDNPRALLLPNGIDAVEDYGLVAGDYAYVTGSGVGNDGTYVISQIISINDRNNNLLIMSTSFPAVESPATGVKIAFRSKYDVLPIKAGLKMKPSEVDVGTFESVKNKFFTQSENNMRFYLTEPVGGKEWMESKIALPLGLYSVTRYGKVSTSVTFPPIAGEKLVTIDETCVIDPQSIVVERGINNRKYFNEVQYFYDKNDGGAFENIAVELDADSLSKIGISTVLPINADGLKTELSAETLVTRRGRYLVNRFRSAAVIITLKVNWRVGSLLENGDIVLLKDEGNLKINNFTDGTRDLGVSLVEVIECQKDIKAGQVKLQLLANLGYQLTDRFGTISPSSIVDGTSSTVNTVKIRDSYGELFPGFEQGKWTDLIGSRIRIHSYNYTQYDAETILTGFDPADDYLMQVSPALPLPPTDGYIVDIIDYPSDTDPKVEAIEKLLFAHITPSVVITSATSQTQFDVGAGDIDKFSTGQPIRVHNDDYSQYSPETIVDDISGTTITVRDALGFVPSDLQIAELIGYTDGGGPYRIL